jgi:uncharacterized protein YbjT (DUF2867 family)
MAVYLVAGANGTVGKQVIAKLRESGESVRAGVRSPETVNSDGSRIGDSRRPASRYRTFSQRSSRPCT